jgi:hypothetical protein
MFSGNFLQKNEFQTDFLRWSYWYIVDINNLKSAVQRRGKMRYCQYFNEDYLGFCSATAFLHVPGISEMEQLCFKDFRACTIYNQFQDVQTPVAKNIVQKDHSCSL